jgi:peptidoglycan/xylan/chitin deacetylase (PgdA/CDA1 family)
MNLRSQARAFLMQAASLAGADSMAFRIQKRRLRSKAVVVAMHETPASLQTQFRKQVEFAARYFRITSFEEFSRLWTQGESEAGSKPLLLYTFDDGRESNYTIAAPLLESFGGRGLFFVVPAFAELAGTDRAFSFYRTRINPDSKPDDENLEEWKPMNPAHIADLASRGHGVGNHSLTHERLVGLSPEKLEREIGDGARLLSSWTKKPVDAFAWTFGWDAIDANAWRAIQRHHRFCFSPCAGAISPRDDHPSLLWRREIELRYSAAEYRFCYSGLVDVWWRNRRARLRDMARASATTGVDAKK